MLTAKRIVIATICGLLFGFVCLGLATSNPNSVQQLTSSAKLLIVISRTMLGFTIGISAIRLKWWMHGIVIGIIASIPMAIPVMGNSSIFAGTFIMGIIYGVLTELITSVLFKAKQPIAETA
jgi:hypothetical protein